MKWLIAFVAVAVLLTAGWLLYNSAIDPPVAETPTPVLPVTPPVTPVTPPALPVVPPVAPVTPVIPVTPPAPPVPAIPPNFIVPDEVWKNAFRLNLVDGRPIRGAVGFSSLPIGTELRAPLDGYVSEGSTTFPSGENVLSLQWTVREQRPDAMGELGIVFNISGAEILNRSPRKGEVFARITGNIPIGVGFYDRETVFVIRVAPHDLNFQTDRTIEDPRAYLWTAIQQLLPIK